MWKRRSRGRRRRRTPAEVMRESGETPARLLQEEEREKSSRGRARYSDRRRNKSREWLIPILVSRKNTIADIM